MCETEGTTPAPESATPNCPRRTTWCSDHAQEFDQCLSTSIDVGRHSVWLKLELHETEPTVIVDASTSNDGLTLAESRRLAGAIEALQYQASCDEVDWCVMAKKWPRDREGHQRFHQSESIELAQGYSAFFYQNREGDTGLRLILEGGPHDVEDTLSAAAMSHLLNAVSTDEGWDAMSDLIHSAQEPE